jgi:prophage regulatory protein
MTSIAHTASRRAVNILQEVVRFKDEDTNNSQLVRLYRLPQVLARIPVSKSSWFAGIQSGRYPRGLQLGPRTTVWRSDDIDNLIKNLGVVA